MKLERCQEVFSAVITHHCFSGCCHQAPGFLVLPGTNGVAITLKCHHKQPLWDPTRSVEGSKLQRAAARSASPQQVEEGETDPGDDHQGTGASGWARPSARLSLHPSKRPAKCRLGCSSQLQLMGRRFSTGRTRTDQRKKLHDAHVCISSESECRYWTGPARPQNFQNCTHPSWLPGKQGS